MKSAATLLLLPPETDAHARHREWLEASWAWCVWQERVEFVRCNGERHRDIAGHLPIVGQYRRVPLGLLPP